MTSEYRIGSPGKGVVSAIACLIGYVVVPYVVMIVLDSYLKSQGMAYDGLNTVLSTSMKVGVFVAIVAFLKGYYERGNKGFLITSVIMAFVEIAFFVIVLNGGNISQIISVSVSGIGTVNIDLAVSTLLMLIIFLKIVDIFVEYCRYRDCRPDFLEEHADILDGTYSSVGERKRAEKEEKKASKKKGKKSGEDDE